MVLLCAHIVRRSLLEISRSKVELLENGSKFSYEKNYKLFTYYWHYYLNFYMLQRKSSCAHNSTSHCNLFSSKPHDISNKLFLDLSRLNTHFLGGVIILFVYITTLANNEKLVIPNFSKTRVALLILARLIFSFSVFNQPLFRLIPALGIYFNPISGRNLILLTLYLLMALTRVVKLRQRTRGSLIRWS